MRSLWCAHGWRRVRGKCRRAATICNTMVPSVQTRSHALRRVLSSTHSLLASPCLRKTQMRTFCAHYSIASRGGKQDQGRWSPSSAGRHPSASSASVATSLRRRACVARNTMHPRRDRLAVQCRTGQPQQGARRKARGPLFQPPQRRDTPAPAVHVRASTANNQAETQCFAEPRKKTQQNLLQLISRPLPPRMRLLLDLCD
jgi:hypothetical protein